MSNNLKIDCETFYTSFELSEDEGDEENSNYLNPKKDPTGR